MCKEEEEEEEEEEEQHRCVLIFCCGGENGAAREDPAPADEVPDPPRYPPAPQWCAPPLSHNQWGLRNALH